LFTAAVALRLARFNTQLEIADKRYFQGLACPSAAALIASWVWVCHEYHLNWVVLPYLTMVLGVAAAFLMVSNIRYQSFKQIDFKGKVSFLSILGMVVVFIGVALNPSIILFLLSFGYAISGPAQTLYVKGKVRRMRRKVAKRR
jgi:CDP-diacylglycerol--serine O-phosphatidyltransferase